VGIKPLQVYPLEPNANETINMGKKTSAVIAFRGEASGNGCVNPSRSGSALVLEQQKSDDAIVRVIARALRAQRPDSEDIKADFLSESMLAYASDRQPRSRESWRAVLLEVLADVGIDLDEDDPEGAAHCVVTELERKGVLVSPELLPELGDLVLAVLKEDDEWHEAWVQEQIDDGVYRLIFLEYGKPQETALAQIRLLASVVDDGVDDGELLEGTCELCSRQQQLTFHHLIPRETHSTWIKRKRLPDGVSGDATSHWLNLYGTMVCRQCHSHIHHSEPNISLAKDYNTLEKLREHDKIQRWIVWASSQKTRGR